jgi:predicted transcriptional regulator
MPGNHIRNTEGLREFSQKKQQETAQKVDKAIQELIKSKDKINFNSVAEKAGVSKVYLYKHLELRDRIELLRKQQQGLPSPKQIKQEMTDSSKDVLIAAKNKRVKELQDEVKRLKDILKRRYGEEY